MNNPEQHSHPYLGAGAREFLGEAAADAIEDAYQRGVSLTTRVCEAHNASNPSELSEDVRLKLEEDLRNIQARIGSSKTGDTE